MLLMTILNVVYVLLAIAMIALILMQRGAGAQAGSGFGGGASSTVFGARGASNFLSKSTKWLAVAFFAISLFMAWYATHSSGRVQQSSDLGVMSAPAGGSVPQAPAGTDTNKGGAVPSAPAGSVPQAPTGDGSVPTAPAQPQQAPEQPKPSPQGG